MKISIILLFDYFLILLITLQQSFILSPRSHTCLWLEKQEWNFKKTWFENYLKTQAKSLGLIHHFLNTFFLLILKVRVIIKTILKKINHFSKHSIRNFSAFLLFCNIIKGQYKDQDHSLKYLKTIFSQFPIHFWCFPIKSINHLIYRILCNLV